MPTLESLQAKRADLSATLEQYVGQINRTNGAIAVLDDLIAEARTEEDRKREAQEQQEAEDALAEQLSADAAKALFPGWKSPPVYVGIDRAPNPYWNNGGTLEPLAAPLAPAPEMLPILRDDEDGSR